MDFTTDDHIEVQRLISLHGHLVDHGELDRLSEIFTDDVSYDLSPLGGPVLHGASAVQEAALELGAGNPVAHHVTNVVVTCHQGNVTARSKFLGVRRDGSVGSGVYEDELLRTQHGWRIARRVVRLRREPLQR